MSTGPIEDVSKLPKWAQYRISKLEKDIKFIQDQLDAYSGKKTNITVDPNAVFAGSLPHYLPDRTTVEYQLKRGTIEIDLYNGDRELHVSSSGTGQLVVVPHCSNVVILKLVKDE